MAKVRLGRYEVEELGLPPVCMRCGAPAVTHRKKKFSWYPPWINVIAPLALLPFAIVAALLTKRMTVQVPFCAAHKRHWFWRSFILFVSFVGIVALAIGGLVLASHLRPRANLEPFAGGALLGGLILWAIIAFFVQLTGIRPKEITDRSITLTNVSENFVHALAQSREAEDPETERRPGKDLPDEGPDEIYEAEAE